MGTTLDALTGDAGVSLRIVVAIEGYGYLLTDGDAAAAVTAWAGTDYVAALSGLTVEWNLDQRLHPWEPFNASSSSVTLRIMDASGTNADTFGLAVFKREGQTVSPLAADVDPGDTTVVVKRSDAFSASGTIHIGNEAIGYTTNTTATETFSVLTRGKWSPFKSEAGARFVRTHRTVPTVPGVPAPDVEAGTSALVVDAPIEWRGRWVGVWLHRDMGGTLDVVAQAHLAFAGRISTVSDSTDGRTVVHVESVQQVINDAVIMREQWRAKLKPGIMLNIGTLFTSRNERMGVSGGTTYADTKDANPLVVVAAGAAGANQINAGVYLGSEVEQAINNWLSSELAAARLIFRQTFRYNDTDPNGLSRSSLYFSDDTVTVQLSRLWMVGVTDPEVAASMGWTDAGSITGSLGAAYSGTAYADDPPLGAKFTGTNPGPTTIYLSDVVGSFAEQTTLLNPWAANLSSAVGVIRVGDFYMPCRAPSVTNGEGSIVVGPQPMNMFIGADTPESATVEAEEGGDIEVSQSLVLEASPATIMLALLASTGGGANWAAYDLLPEHCSAAIPYDLMTTDLEAEILATPGSGDPMRVIIDDPMKLPDILGASFVMRLIQFVWRQGRLALRGYATPTSAATLALTADDRATPIDTEDTMLAVTTESDALMRNVIKIQHNANARGDKFRDTITITDPGSAASFGAKALTIKARNATRSRFNEGENIDGLLPTFLAGIPFLVRPALVLRVPLDHNMIEQATPGEVCLLTDGFARDPATGIRGIASRPALILAQNASWGGIGEAARCEVDLVIFPRLSLATYSPCAQVDDTAANAGYNAGTKVLTCYAHEHSEAGAVADATLFLAGHKVRIIEIDPAVAAAPLTWDDTVVSQTGNTITLTTGLAGWDTGLKYRVTSDTYGDAITAQQAKVYQADDADGLVVNARAPYSYAFNPTGQVANAAASVATELPERPPTAAYGDGVALDTGHARAVARGVNNLISYKTAPQHPNALAAAEVMTYSGSGTWTMVWIEPVYIGVGLTTGVTTRKLYVSPTIAKSGGASANVRVTLSRRPPRSADPTAPSLDDVTRIAPYSATTFNTTSASYENQAAVGLDISHLQLAPGHGGNGGMGWLYVECATLGLFRGFGVKYVGALEAA